MCKLSKKLLSMTGYLEFDPDVSNRNVLFSMPYVSTRVKSIEDFTEMFLDITILIDITESNKYEEFELKIDTCLDSFDMRGNKESRKYNFSLLSNTYSDIVLSVFVFEMDEDYKKINISRKIKLEKLNLL